MTIEDPNQGQQDQVNFVSSVTVVEVRSIRQTVDTATTGGLIFDLTVDVNGVLESNDKHLYLPTDPYGFNPAIKEWLIANPEFPIDPYVPLTPDEIRANMFPLARIDFRNKFRLNGITTTVINNYIAGIMDPNLQEERQIFWEDSQMFRRLDPFVIELGQAAGKTAEQIDTIWMS